MNEINFQSEMQKFARDYGFSQKNIATISGFSQASVNRWLRGKRLPHKMTQVEILNRMKASKRIMTGERSPEDERPPA